MKSRSSLEDKQQYSSLLNNLRVGILASTFDVFATHPLFVLKTRKQCNYSFTLNPKILYRGSFGNALSIVPTISTQIVVNGIILEQFDTEKKSSITAKAVSSFGAGACSTIMSNPAELVLVQQQKTNQKFIATAIIFSKKQRFIHFYSGFIATAMRSGFVSSGFITQMPFFKDKLKNNGFGDTPSSLIGGACAGVISAVCSHPFDTIKTLQQKAADVEQKSFSTVVKEIISTQGSVGFFKGVVARGTRVVSATVILGDLNQRLR